MGEYLSTDVSIGNARQRNKEDLIESVIEEVGYANDFRSNSRWVRVEQRASKGPGAFEHLLRCRS